MEPGAELTCELPGPADRVDRPGVRRACGGDHGDGDHPGRSVLPQRVLQRPEVQAEKVVRRDRSDARAPHAEHRGRAVNRVVRLSGGVQGEPSTVEPRRRRVEPGPLERPLTSSAQGDEVRRRATAGVDAEHVVAESAQLSEPLEGQLLEPVEGGERLPLRGGDHPGGGDDGRDRRRTGGDEGPGSRGREAGAVGQDLGDELLDRRVGADAVLRDRPPEAVLPPRAVGERVRLVRRQPVVQGRPHLREVLGEVPCRGVVGASPAEAIRVWLRSVG